MCNNCNSCGGCGSLFSLLGGIFSRNGGNCGCGCNNSCNNASAYAANYGFAPSCGCGTSPYAGWDGCGWVTAQSTQSCGGGCNCGCGCNN